jgi:transposase
MTPKEFRVQLHNEVSTALVTTTDSYDKIAAKFGISNRTVYDIVKARHIKRPVGAGKPGPKKQAV